MKLREALDLIEFATREEAVDRVAVRQLVDDVRWTLLGLRVDPDTPLKTLERKERTQ